MADTPVPTSLTESFLKIFDAVTDAGKSFTIQNNTLVDIVFLKKGTVPVAGAKGLILGAGLAGAVLDVSDDVYFRATNSRGSTLTVDERA